MNKADEIRALFKEMWRDFWRATRTVEPFTIGASRLEPHTLFGVDYHTRLEALLAELPEERGRGE